MTEVRVTGYTRDIGMGEDTLVAAFKQMEVMLLDQFEKILQLLWIAAASLFTFVYSNIRLATNVLQIEPGGGSVLPGLNEGIP